MKDSIINIDSDLIAIIEAINSAPAGIAFLVNSNNTFHSVFTDGDLRRMLLKEKKLSTKLSVEYHNKSSITAKEGEDIFELMNRINVKVQIIPILDDHGVLVDYFEYKHKTHFTPIAEPDLTGKELEYLVDAFSSTWISSRGAYIDKFENEFANYCETTYGVSTSNGTVAIHLALKALGIGEGDEVIIPDLTFAATINAVLHANATPVIVDIKEDDWTIDSNEIKKAISNKTKAIIPVHVYGQPCDMDIIMQLAKQHNLFVIEDCAEAHGAEFKGAKVGSFGDISTFSFFANKIITTGEGGMCVTNNDQLNQRMRILRDHGMSTTKKYWHDEVGYNYRMTNLQAAIGCAQLERISEIHQLNSGTENNYRKLINDKTLINWQNNLENKNKVTWLICGTVDKNRDKIIEELRKKGIDSRPFFFSLGDMPVYKPYLFSNKISKKIAAKGINLPVKMTEAIDEKINTIKNILKENTLN